MLRMVGFGDNAGSGFPSILATWEAEGWIEPKLVEDTNLNQVTLFLKMEKKEDLKSDIKLIQKNERSLKEDLKEVFSAKDYEKLLPIIEYLEGQESITTQIAEKLIGKAPATAWRYLKKLESVGVLKSDGNTNNSNYLKC